MRPLISPFESDIFESFLTRELFAVACNLHALTYILEINSQQPRKIGPIQREFFEDTFTTAQHTLVSFPHPTEISSTTPAYYRQHSWRIAAFIYTTCALRTWDLASPHVQFMVADLVTSLKAADLTSWALSSPEILVWELFIGAMAAWEIVDKIWLLMELKRGVALLGADSATKLEELLQSLLYPVSMLRRRLYEVWEEMLEL